VSTYADVCLAFLNGWKIWQTAVVDTCKPVNKQNRPDRVRCALKPPKHVE